MSTFGVALRVAYSARQAVEKSSIASSSSLFFRAVSCRYLSYTPTGPSNPGKTWERSAQMVKNTDVKNQYLEHIRDAHDPALHIKTLEDELRGSIGAALGKQGQKILRALRSMQEELEQYEMLLEEHPMTAEIVLEKAQKYNYYRDQAKKARWELIVHRQAAGMIVNNHNFVGKSYPISPPLPETHEQIEKFQKGEVQDDQQMNTGQLDWWQRVGRWR